MFHCKWFYGTHFSFSFVQFILEFKKYIYLNLKKHFIKNPNPFKAKINERKKIIKKNGRKRKIVCKKIINCIKIKILIILTNDLLKIYMKTNLKLTEFLFLFYFCKIFSILKGESLFLFYAFHCSTITCTCDSLHKT